MVERGRGCCGMGTLPPTEQLVVSPWCNEGLSWNYHRFEEVGMFRDNDLPLPCYLCGSLDSEGVVALGNFYNWMLLGESYTVGIVTKGRQLWGSAGVRVEGELLRF